VPLATALCKNLPAENVQRQFSRPKPTRVVEPTEEEEEEEYITYKLTVKHNSFLLQSTTSGLHVSTPSHHQALQ
jgi:hypothetical protein